jgi:hypothetical protein
LVGLKASNQTDKKKYEDEIERENDEVNIKKSLHLISYLV